MKRFTVWIAALVLMMFAGTAWAGKDKVKVQLRIEVDLVDGSHIVGVPNINSVLLQTSYAKLDVPLKEVRTITMGADHETVALDLNNGDKIKGIITVAPIKLETVFGRVAIGIEHIRVLRVMAEGLSLPSGEGTLFFGGVNWMPWRTMFELQGDKLVSLPKGRPGFNYGHSGSGRGPILMTNIGSPDWKDYSIEFEYCMTGVNPAFNPYSLPLDYRGGIVMFHVADAKESWNERGGSCYGLFLQDNGEWNLRCTYNDYCAVPSGYGNHTRDSERTLANGRGLKLNKADGNRFRIDVCGSRIQIWVDGEKVVDVRDDKMGECIGGQTLDHGGIGFHWGMDSMGWIRNFTAQRL